MTSKHGHGSGHHGSAGATHVPEAHDPEHDIDARSATIWFILGAVVVFLALWLMVPIFIRVLEAERERKIHNVPNTELDDVKDAEMQFLNGANPTKKAIDQVLREMAAK